MPRYFIEVAYKGTNYAGFQIQKNANTIQAELERAILVKFGYAFELTGSSRTDAGVHALQNYFHFDVDDHFFSLLGEEVQEDFFRQSVYNLNAILPDDIAVKRIFRVKDGFHCRYDAISRHYKYYIYSSKNPFHKDFAHYYPYPADISDLQAAASIILDTRDFTSFSKRNTEVNNFFCSVYKSEWRKENDLLVYDVIANRFLRGMVKGLVGTMLKVGTGKISIKDFIDIIKGADCAKADFSVSSQGLFLMHVRYKESESF